MPTTTPLTDAINALTSYSNTVTGQSDQTLSEAVATLAAGWSNTGSSSGYTPDPNKPLTSSIESLTYYANSVTGASDQTLSEAVATLAAGYGSPLPSGYTRYDYLRNTSMTQGTYLDINYPTADTDVYNYNVQIDFVVEGANTFSDTCPFGARPTTSNTVNDFTVYIKQNTMNQLAVHYGGADTGFTSLDMTQRTVLNFEKGKVFANSTQIFDTLTSSMILKSGFPMRLFNRRNANTNQRQCLLGKIYGFSIKDGNGDYIVNLVPCTNDTNIAGMYDLVRETFYAPSVTMTAGNE